MGGERWRRAGFVAVAVLVHQACHVEGFITGGHAFTKRGMGRSCRVQLPYQASQRCPSPWLVTDSSRSRGTLTHVSESVCASAACGAAGVGRELRKDRRERTALHAAITLQPAVVRASVGAVMRLVSTCALGVAAASAKVLDPAAVTALSRLIFAIFQPALLFTNVAQTLARPAGFGQSLVVLPIAAIGMILIGAFFGAILSKVLRVDPESDGGKELAICSSFANSGPLPLLFVDALFRTHPDQTLLPRAVAYISFYLLTWSPMFWIYGRFLLSGKAQAQTTPSTTAASSNPIKRFLSHPATGRIFSPPTMGCILGAIAGATPLFRDLLLSPSAPLAPLFDALRTMGQAYLPTVLLVLAGSLAQGLKGFQWGMVKQVGALMFSRFALMPLTVFALLNTALRMGLVPRQDALLHFILLMMASMPSAQNSVVILQLEKRPEAAGSMARLISIMYILSVLPVGLLLSVFLQHVGI